MMSRSFLVSYRSVPCYTSCSSVGHAIYCEPCQEILPQEICLELGTNQRKSLFTRPMSLFQSVNGQARGVTQCNLITLISTILGTSNTTKGVACGKLGDISPASHACFL